MSTAVLLFAATFGVVFALGLQSLNVNGGHRALAFVTSFAIGLSNLVLFKVLPGPTDALQIAAYLLGGPFGILASMWAHPRLVHWMAQQRSATAATRAADRAASWAPGKPLPATPAPQRSDTRPGQREPASADDPAQALCRDLLDPEELGHQATPEIRNRARAALGFLSREVT